MPLVPISGEIRSQPLNDNFSYLDSKTNNISKGNPSGVFATVSDLTAAYPNGNSNIYVVTADGNWYFWNGTAWTAGGAFQSTGIPDNSISNDKLTELGLYGNRGADYPLRSVERNGQTTVIHQDLKNAILDMKIIGAKPDKYYRLQFVGNGTTSFDGIPFYGFVVYENDKATFSTNSNTSQRQIILRTDYNFPQPFGLTTRVLRSSPAVDDIIFSITLDYSKLVALSYNLDNATVGYSAVIDESCYIHTKDGLLETNRGLEFPFKKIQRGGQFHQDISKEISNAFLDVKIINANPNKIYKIDYVGNGTTSFPGGIPEYAIYLQEMDPDFTDIQQIFNRTNAHLDAPDLTNGSVVTRIITHASTNIVMSCTIDFSKLTQLNYTMNQSIYPGYGHIIHESCYIQSKSGTSGGESGIGRMSLTKSGDIFTVQSPYATGTDIVWTFGKLGINEILHLTDIKLLEDGVYTSYQTISTDWLSPYNFSAVNNTQNATAITTGGNHGTDGNDGFRTAYPVYKRAFANGVEITEDTKVDNIEEIIIETSNDITSSNVMNLTTGADWRAVITEYVTYRITPRNLSVVVTVKANEDIVMNRYAGPQISGFGTTYSNAVFGGDLTTSVLTTTGSNQYTGTKAQGSQVDRFIMEGATSGYVAVTKDHDFDVNDLRFFPNNVGIGLATNSKLYLMNFDSSNAPFSQNETFAYDCIYSFIPELLDCPDAVRAYNVKDIYYVEFSGSANTHLRVQPEHKNKKITIISFQNVTTPNQHTTEFTKLVSTGHGWIKFKVE